MRTLVTPEEMRRADRRAVEAGTPVEVLMDRAGQGVARVAIEMLGGRYGKKVVVVCGKGNNGGDGYAAARILKREGVAVICLAVTDPSDLKGAARHHYEQARRAGVRVNAFDLQWLHADLVIDAVLGTGFAAYREGPDPAMSAVDAIQRLRQSDGGMTTSASVPLILAVDIPSGISGERGVIGGTHVIADRTVTFAAEKIGTFLSPPQYVGKVEIADIGLEVDGKVRVMDPDDVSRALPKRRVDSHKRSSGSIAVLAGSDAMTGAAALVVRGALRAGCGYVTVGCTARVAEVIQSLCPEALVRVLTHEDHLGPKVLRDFREVIETSTMLAVGPGLGTGKDQATLIEALISDHPVPMVIDADGLNALGGRTEQLADHKATIAITPHPAEFARLMDLDVHEVERSRLELAEALVRRCGVEVLLKGHRTVIAGLGEQGLDQLRDLSMEAGEVRTYLESFRLFLNPTGGPELATAGTGDVLTGVAATFLAGNRFEAGTEALAAAAYVHGLAGQIAASHRSDSGVVAWDVAEALPAAIASLR